jgi:hypothetical protein
MPYNYKTLLHRYTMSHIHMAAACIPLSFIKFGNLLSLTAAKGFLDDMIILCLCGPEDPYCEVFVFVVSKRLVQSLNILAFFSCFQRNFYSLLLMLLM